MHALVIGHSNILKYIVGHCYDQSQELCRAFLSPSALRNGEDSCITIAWRDGKDQSKPREGEFTSSRATTPLSCSSKP